MFAVGTDGTYSGVCVQDAVNTSSTTAKFKGKNLRFYASSTGSTSVTYDSKSMNSGGAFGLSGIKYFYWYQGPISEIEYLINNQTG